MKGKVACTLLSPPILFLMILYIHTQVCMCISVYMYIICTYNFSSFSGHFYSFN